jgi:hypothetical protein
MNTARKFLTGAALAALAACLPARAEVSAQTDTGGNYLRTVIYSNASAKNFRIWTVSRLRLGYWPLNPSGDLSGDLWPTIAEGPLNQRWPWVVWSHFDGQTFDLVFSRWTGTGWMVTSNVAASASGRDELDPRVSFDMTGRPHLVWVSSGVAGPDHVYLSVFLSTRWMAPFLVSNPLEDAQNPDIVVQPDGTIVVSYDTPAGHVTRTVRFLHPLTITDDITPFSTVSVTSTTTTPSLHP